MQLVPALKRGLLMGLAMGAAGLLNGRIGEGLVLIASFTGVGVVVARLALKTVVVRGAIARSVPQASEDDAAGRAD